MTADELLFFDPMPQVLSIYDTLRERLLAACPDVEIKVSKTQISFKNPRIFAMVSLPLHRRKGWPEVCLVVSFGLGRQAVSPRIVSSVQPYPGRWTHHTLIEQPESVDDELMAWLDEAYGFARVK